MDNKVAIIATPVIIDFVFICPPFLINTFYNKDSKNVPVF
jgi:hypothetical protein